MILIFGGAYQGKNEFAKNILGYPEEKIFDISQDENIMKSLMEGEDPGSWIDLRLDELKDKAVIIHDLSQGLVPVDPKERAFREANGRAMIKLAEKADEVYRVFCTIGSRLK